MSSCWFIQSPLILCHFWSVVRICRRFFVFAVFVSYGAVPAHGWEAVVISVVDGDTLLAAPAGASNPEQGVLRVRLYGIDAPEMDQPGGQGAKSALENFVRPGDFVEVTPMDGDRYGRSVGLVLSQGKIVNFELVRQCHAWVYDKYCRADCCRVWRKTMKETKWMRCGLWGEENPVPPWEWRNRAVK